MSRVRLQYLTSGTRQSDVPGAAGASRHVRGGLSPLTCLTRRPLTLPHGLDRNGVPVPLASALAELADRLARLVPSHRDPEQFHMDKAELAAELRALAHRLRRPA